MFLFDFCEQLSVLLFLFLSTPRLSSLSGQAAGRCFSYYVIWIAVTLVSPSVAFPKGFWIPGVLSCSA